MAQPRQYRLLVIERSRTLRHSIVTLLKNAAGDELHVELDLVDSFDLAERRLQAAPGGYDGVVIGWPLAVMQSDEAFQSLLNNPALSDLYVLVLSHDRVPGARAWVQDHGNAGYVLWHDADEIFHSIRAGLNNLVRSHGISLVPDGDASAGLSFLLVDDSASSRVFFRRLLGSRGFSVDTAASVTEARKKLARRRYDIAVIDYYLPEMTGDAFVREIKANSATRELACCIITGAYSDTLIRTSLDAGAIECLFKNEAGELLLSQVDAIARMVRGNRIHYEKEQLLDGILDSVGEGVFGVDENGRVAFANQRAINMLGYANETALIGADAEALFIDAGSDSKTAGIAWMRMAYAARGFLKPLARQMIHLDGSLVDVTASVYPLRIREREIGTVVSVREIARDRSLERQAWWHATHDVETGVLNRRYFEVQLESELHQLRRTTAHHAMLMVALESQTGSNGSAQFEAPDSELLRDVANRLVDRARSSDLVAYFGDGRFGLLLRDAAPEYATSIQAGFRSLLEIVTAQHVGLYASAGIAVFDNEIRSANEIIALASLAQRVASGKGLGGIQFHLAEADESRSDNVATRADSMPSAADTTNTQPATK